jgi:putative endonuclease
MRDRYNDHVKTPCVYLLASKRNGVLYAGVTSDLHTRMQEHVGDAFAGFTSRYSVKMLVYYEMHEGMIAAIAREKRMKEWKRAWKVRLIHNCDPEWLDLYDRETGAIADAPADVQRGVHDLP